MSDEPAIRKRGFTSAWTVLVLSSFVLKPRFVLDREFSKYAELKVILWLGNLCKWCERSYSHFNAVTLKYVISDNCETIFLHIFANLYLISVYVAVRFGVSLRVPESACFSCLHGWRIAGLVVIWCHLRQVWIWPITSLQYTFICMFFLIFQIVRFVCIVPRSTLYIGERNIFSFFSRILTTTQLQNH